MEVGTDTLSEHKWCEITQCGDTSEKDVRVRVVTLDVRWWVWEDKWWVWALREVRWERRRGWVSMVAQVMGVSSQGWRWDDLVSAMSVGVCENTEYGMSGNTSDVRVSSQGWLGWDDSREKSGITMRWVRRQVMGVRTQGWRSEWGHRDDEVSEDTGMTKWVRSQGWRSEQWGRTLQNLPP